jgi:exodeoxyribonuclease V alpha subunit
VLGDLVNSGKVPYIALKKIFRQSSESLIVSNAHAIIGGEIPDLSNNSGDFFFLTRDSAQSVTDTVLELCSKRLPDAYGFDGIRDIQVLCPSRKYETGSLNNNNLLQQFLNANVKGVHLSYKGVYYYRGDKVMQIKNNYDLQWEKPDGETGFGVFNGDVGFITEVNAAAGSLCVLFDDNSKVMYTAETLGEIELAYAITIHKSQGSEFDCVVMPVFGVPAPLAYRKLLYTGVTRAKKLFVAVGDRQTFVKMCQNDKKTLRYTLLKEFLDERYE